MKRLSVAAAGVACAAILAGAASAQESRTAVRVGWGYAPGALVDVVAPGTRVLVGPGGTHVDAWGTQVRVGHGYVPAPAPRVVVTEGVYQGHAVVESRVVGHAQAAGEGRVISERVVSERVISRDGVPVESSSGVVVESGARVVHGGVVQGEVVQGAVVQGAVVPGPAVAGGADVQVLAPGAQVGVHTGLGEGTRVGVSAGGVQVDVAAPRIFSRPILRRRW